MTCEVIDGLRRFARAAALPLKSVALAVHAKALSVEANQQAIVTGLVSHGRPEVLDGDHARIERLLFDGAREPEKGALRPDLSRSGMGIELKRADARRYAV